MLEGLTQFGRQWFGDILSAVNDNIHPFDIWSTLNAINPNYSQIMFNRDFNLVENHASRVDNAQRLRDSTTLRASMYSRRDFAYTNGNYGHVVSFDWFNPIDGSSGTDYLTVVSNDRLSKQDIFDRIQQLNADSDYPHDISNFQLQGAFKNP